MQKIICLDTLLKRAQEYMIVEAVESYKRWMVKRSLEECGGNQTRAAEMLGMHRSSLNRLMKELDLR